MHVIILDMSCFFMARIVNAWKKANDPDFIPEETAAMSIARITNTIDPHADVMIVSQSLKPGQSVWQHRVKSDYRCKAELLEKDVVDVAETIINIVEGMGMSVLQSPNAESDDLAAEVALNLRAAGGRVSVVSNSLRLLPLIEYGIAIREPFGGRRNERWCIRKYGVKPVQIPDYLAWVGCGRFDGLAQIGKRRAAKVLQTWENIETIVMLPPCSDRIINIIKEHAYKALINKVLASSLSLPVR